MNENITIAPKPGIEGHGRTLRWVPYYNADGTVGWELVAYWPWPNGKLGRPLTLEPKIPNK